MIKSDESEFIRQNLGLVHSLCKRFTGRNIEYDDLFQAGSMGLLKAAREFDEDRGYKFSTYAVPVILGEIKRLFRDNGAIKVSRSLKELSLKVTAVKEYEERKNGVTPTVAEIASKLGASAEDVAEAIASSRAVMSLTVEDDETLKQLDLPTVDNSENINDRIMISSALEKLKTEDRNLIIMRYFCGMTQSEIASKLKLTQVQVSRKEKKLLEMMKQGLK